MWAQVDFKNKIDPEKSLFSPMKKERIDGDPIFEKLIATEDSDEEEEEVVIPEDEKVFVPGKRRGHSAVLFGDSMYIYGGLFANQAYKGDVCAFNFSKWLLNIQFYS